MHRLLITGGSGFVGRNLLALLENTSYPLALVMNRQSIPLSRPHLIIKNDNNLSKNVTKFNPTIIIHLASFTTARDDEPLKIIDTNLTFLISLLDASKNLKFFINTGSFAEFRNNDEVPNPAYLYSASKIASRAFLDYYSAKIGFTYCTIIPYTIYGYGDNGKKVIDYIISSLNAKKEVAMSALEQKLDFIHIRDVARFYQVVLENLNLIENKDNYYLGSGANIKLKNLVKIIENLSGQKANIAYGALPYRPLDILEAKADISSLKKFNFYSEISLEEGLKEILKLSNFLAKS